MCGGQAVSLLGLRMTLAAKLSSRLLTQMLLRSDRVRFSNPTGKLIIQIFRTLQAERMQMISRRESLDAGKPRMLDSARKNKVTDEIVSADLHGDERHAHLKGYAGLLR